MSRSNNRAWNRNNTIYILSLIERTNAMNNTETIDALKKELIGHVKDSIERCLIKFDRPCNVCTFQNECGRYKRLNELEKEITQ